MPLYELMCIATLQSTPQQLVNSLQKLAVVVQKGKGVFRRVENLGVRPLAYRMKAHMKYNTVGRFMRFYIQASPLLVADVEARLRIDDNIVRTMTVKHNQVAPVVIEKRRRHDKVRDYTSTTGVLSHEPLVDYEAAKVLLALNYLKPEDILSLPRHNPDASWESYRKDEQMKRAQGGSAYARSLLQLPVPTRQDDLSLMKKLGDAEEEEMQAYESYRKSNNERKFAAAEQYIVDENAALARRMEWYGRSGQAMRDRKMARKILNYKKPRTQEDVIRLVKDHPMRYQRKGKPIPEPEWARRDREEAEAAASSASSSSSSSATATQ